MPDTSLTDFRLSSFVEQQAKNCFYYQQTWLDLITRLYGYSVIPLTTTNSAGQITGFLPLCFMKSPLTGRRLVSLPFSDHCPLLAVNSDSASDLVEQAIHLAQEKKVKYLELRTGGNGILAQHPDLTEGNLYVRWLMQLTTNFDFMWSGVQRSVKQRIKKSQKVGLRVRLSQSPEDIAHYYRLHLQTRCKKHGMPAQSHGFFLELWNSFATKGVMKLLLVEYQGTIIAGMILLVSGKTVRVAYSASDEHYLNLSPNNLLWWEAITWSASQGYQILDLGRTARDNEGLMEFKRHWGAIQEPLPYYYFPHIAGLAATPEQSWKYRLLTSCWKQLPLQVTEPLGSHLYKYLG